MKDFLNTLARIGSDNPPSLEELSAARDGIARELHRLKREGVSDLAALTSVREAYQLAAAAVKELEAKDAEARAELEAALDDVPDPDADPDAAEDEDTEDAPVTASALSVVEAVRRLGLMPVEQAPAAPAPVDPAQELATTRTTLLLNNRPVENPTIGDVAKIFSEASARTQRVGQEKFFSARTEFASDRSLTGKIADDTSLVESFMSPEAVTAAGGCCSLPEPIRANPVAGSTARPIRDALGTLGARAGAFTFFPAICDIDGVGLWTCEQDAAVDPEDPTTWKTCAASECDDPQTVNVEAIYTCRTVGNFKQRFAPEQWRAELQKLAIQQARVAEVALFAKMRAEVTTTHQLTDTGSVYVSLLQGVALAAAAIRQDQRLSNVRLTYFLPEWVQLAAWSDMVGKRVANVEDPVSAAALITQALARINVRTVFSPDIDPIEDESPGQVDGPLTPYPAVAHGVLAPDGFFTYLDGGQLDLGTEIRDHDLNRQNSLAAFSEVFEGLLARGCNAKGLDLPVTVCDNAPCPV